MRTCFEGPRPWNRNISPNRKGHKSCRWKKGQFPFTNYYYYYFWGNKSRVHLLTSWIFSNIAFGKKNRRRKAGLTRAGHFILPFFFFLSRRRFKFMKNKGLYLCMWARNLLYEILFISPRAVIYEFLIYYLVYPKKIPNALDWWLRKNRLFGKFFFAT